MADWLRVYMCPRVGGSARRAVSEVRGVIDDRWKCDLNSRRQSESPISVQFRDLPLRTFRPIVARKAD